MKPPRSSENELILGLVSVSDRASSGIYEDKGIPSLEAWCRKAISTPIKVHKRLIADEKFDIEKTLRELVDIIGCDLILTTGGTGPSRRDVTPEATLAVATREMPGFGEQMRAISGHFVPTAILSRQVAVLRETPDHAALIINLPGQPKAIAETLEGLKDKNGRRIVNGIFAAVPYCIDLIGGPYIETNEDVVKAFRPKSAIKKNTVEQKVEESATKTEKTESKPQETKPAPQEPKVEEKQVPKQEEKPKTPPFAASDILVVKPRRSVPTPLTMVWLHGMGVDNTDFSDFADELVEFGAPGCRIVLPNAPRRILSLHPGYPIRAWYDVKSDKIDDNEDFLGIAESARKVSELIKEIEANGIPRSRIVLGGFSQGAAISLYAGLRQESPLGGIIALSGYLPLASKLYSEVTQAGRTTPIFMGHGIFDSIVSPMIAQRSSRVISEVNPNFAFRTYEMEHSLCAEELADIAAFLNGI